MSILRAKKQYPSILYYGAQTQGTWRLQYKSLFCYDVHVLSRKQPHILKFMSIIHHSPIMLPKTWHFLCIIIQGNFDAMIALRLIRDVLLWPIVCWTIHSFLALLFDLQVISVSLGFPATFNLHVSSMHYQILFSFQAITNAACMQLAVFARMSNTCMVLLCQSNAFVFSIRFI